MRTSPKTLAITAAAAGALFLAGCVAPQQRPYYPPGQYPQQGSYPQQGQPQPQGQPPGQYPQQGPYSQQQPYPQQQQPGVYAPTRDRDKTWKGAGLGALAGAVVGAISGNSSRSRRERALIGAGLGALAGGAIGNYQDRNEAMMREELAGTGVDVVRRGDDIILNLPSNITFAFDSAEVKPEFYPVLDRVAGVANQNQQTILEVAGHTDSVGTDAYNQGLSERRAHAVGSRLIAGGVLRDRLIMVGGGEQHPVASNDTDAGRAQNRRVEITVMPIRQ